MNFTISHICKNIFNKIFKNLAEELNIDIADIQIGILFENGISVYEVYNKFTKVKNIELSDYCNIMDLLVGIEVINSTINQAGAGYAKELNCDIKCINVILQYNGGKMPNAILLKDNDKIRNIDIQQDF